jgi:hypothetical protein
MAYDRPEYEKTEYMGEENVKEDVWKVGRTRNVEDRNYLGIAGAVCRFRCSRRQKGKIRMGRTSSKNGSQKGSGENI